MQEQSCEKWSGFFGARPKQLFEIGAAPSHGVKHDDQVSFFFPFHLRVFSRIAMIPFNKVSGIHTLQKSLSLKAFLQPLIKKSRIEC